MGSFLRLILIAVMCGLLGLAGQRAYGAPSTSSTQPVEGLSTAAPANAGGGEADDPVHSPGMADGAKSLSRIYPIPMAGADDKPTGGKVVIVKVDGEINDMTRYGLIQRVNEAKAMGATSILLVVNTYGGMVSSTLEITNFLRSQQDVPVTAFVEKKAYSAGSIIAVSCKRIVMETGAVMGDAAPINGNGQSLAPTERAKAESPLFADMDSSAEKNGYDPLLLRSLVSMNPTVYAMTRGGQIQFVPTSHDADKLAAQGWTVPVGVINPVDGPDSMLTLSASKAKAIGLSAGTYASPEEYITAHGMTLIGTLSQGIGEKVVGYLSGEFIRTILIIVFLQALYMSITHPGTGAPEATAVIALALLLGVPMLTGFAGMWEVLAILLGIALLALELFVIPGFGVTGITGIVLILGGLVMTFVPSGPILPGFLPSLSSTWTGIWHGITAVVIGMAVSMVLWIWLARHMQSVPFFNRLILAVTRGDRATVTGVAVDGATGAATNKLEQVVDWPAKGAVGRVATDLKTGGIAEFIDEATGDWRSVDVVSDSGFVAAGTQIRVLEIRGGYVIVRPVNAATARK